MTKFKSISLVVLTLAFFTACGGGGGGTTSTTPPPTTNVTINAPVQVVPLGKSSVNVNVNITNGPKDLYILLSNYSTVLGSSPAITHNPKTVASVQPKKGLNILQSSMKHKIHAPKEVEAFRTKSFQYLQQGKRSSSTREAKIFASTPIRQADVVGNVGNFQLNITAGVTTAATARKVVSAQTAFGMKTLNIWVSNDSFDAGAGCLKTNCVTQAMVDALAVRFLQTGTDNDIYDWVTNIYGTEWGAYAAANYGNLIPYDGNITILLTDIGNDNSTNGGVLGYFYAKDNYLPSTASGSNQRVMFYLDSVLFATPSGGTPWTITDLWPREMISTLAHEFQHMITFYQKGVLLNSQPPQTWLSEMLAETTEDVVATRLLGNGPRNVPYTDGSAGTPFNTGGRYPLFNNDPTLSLTNWSGIVDDYSKVSAFGTFLIRNYGGAKLLHDMVANTLTGTDAVVQAVHLTPQGAGKTFDDLLTEWGVAVLLSDRTNLPVGMPQYNTGAFTLDTYNGNGINYQLGSINFFNYLPQPNIATASGTVNPQGNYYYKVGTALSGLVQIGLTLNGNTQATLIAK